MVPFFVAHFTLISTESVEIGLSVAVAVLITRKFVLNQIQCVKIVYYAFIGSTNRLLFQYFVANDSKVKLGSHRRLMIHNLNVV